MDLQSSSGIDKHFKGRQLCHKCFFLPEQKISFFKKEVFAKQKCKQEVTKVILPV